MTKKHIDKIVKKGKDAEQDFLNWLDENKFSYLYINQDTESFPKLFTNPDLHRQAIDAAHASAGDLFNHCATL